MSSQNQNFRDALQELYILRKSVCDAGALSAAATSTFLAIFCKLSQCKSVGLINYVENNDYKLIDASSGGSSRDELKTDFTSLLTQTWLATLINKADQQGYAIKQSRNHTEEPTLVIVKLWLASPHYLLIASDTQDVNSLRDIVLKAQLVIDFFIEDSSINCPNSMRSSKDDLSSQYLITDLLDLFVSVYESKNFQSALYTLCNGLVARFEEVDQVVIGWQEGVYVQVKAISHYERFERKTDTVKLFEAALEESVDQDAFLDASKDTHSVKVNLAQQQLKTHLAAQSVLTFPIESSKYKSRCGVTLVGFDKDIRSETVQAHVFLMQVLISKLDELFHHDAGLVIKSKYIAYKTLGRWFGRDNLLVKSLILSVVLVFLASLSFKTMHYVSGSAQMVTDNTRLISAPVDGVIAKMYVTSGDEVAVGDPLLVIDTQELILQLTELQAELQRNQAEVGRSRAQFSSVDLAVAEARVEQVKARIERVEFQINESSISAPISGVVVEGQKHELISTPVSRGQHLVRIAQMDDLYLMVRILERDVHFLAQASRGYFALLNQPNRKIPIEIKTLIPMAQVTDQKGPEFVLMAKIDGDFESWWRPGMTGVAKIEIEPRSYFWVYTHLTLNRIRLALW